MRCHRPLSMLIATAVMVCGLGSVTLGDQTTSAEATVESTATASAQFVVARGDGDESKQQFEIKLPAGEGQQPKTIIVRINQDGQVHVESDGKVLDTQKIKLDKIQVQGKPAGVAVFALKSGDGETKVVGLPQVKVEAHAVQVQPDAKENETHRARVIRVESKPDEAGEAGSVRALIVRPQGGVAEERVEIIREGDAKKDADQPLRLRIRKQESPSDGKAEDKKTEAVVEEVEIRRLTSDHAEAEATVKKLTGGQLRLTKSASGQVHVLTEEHDDQDGKRQFRIEIQTDGQIDPAKLKSLVEKVRAEHEAHQHAHKHADDDQDKVEKKAIRVQVLGSGDLNPEKLKALHEKQMAEHGGEAAKDGEQKQIRVRVLSDGELSPEKLKALHEKLKAEHGGKAAKGGEQKQIRVHVLKDGDFSPEKLKALTEKLHAEHAGEKAAKDGEQKQIRVRVQTDGPSKTASGNTMILRKERPQDTLETRLDRIEKELAALRKLLEKK